MVPIGSSGDVHPYVAVGLALRALGHDVTIVTSPVFAELIRRVGLRLIPIGTVEQFENITRHPHLWHPNRGLEVIAGGIRLASHELYEVIKNERRGGDFILVGSGLAFAARLAHETLGLPYVTMHLQPSVFLSAYDTPVLHPLFSGINRLPFTLKQPLIALIDRVADIVLTPAARNLCADLGLPPPHHIASHWWHSPQRVIGLFPEWFGPKQPDWPSQVFLTGFPLYDEIDVVKVPMEIERFLDRGPPPVVYTAGSANLQARKFYAAAVDASQRTGRRALLLTRYREQLPSILPEGVAHSDYVPFSHVLPRSAAVVHHGGIGTAAQGLAAGLPQLIMPMTFDQPDNARRLVELGVARALHPRSFRGPQVADALDTLLGSLNVRKRCEELGGLVKQSDPISDTCALIQDLS